MLDVSERESPSVLNRQLMRSLTKIHAKHVNRKKWIVIFRGPSFKPYVGLKQFTQIRTVITIRKISIKVVDKPFPILPFVFDTSVCPLLASFERPITTATGATIIENENIIVILLRRLIIFKILNSV